MNKPERCISCGRSLLGESTYFDCPVCEKYTIGRCAKCRMQGVLYKCTECNFMGP